MQGYPPSWRFVNKKKQVKLAYICVGQSWLDTQSRPENIYTVTDIINTMNKKDIENVDLATKKEANNGFASYSKIGPEG